MGVWTEGTCAHSSPRQAKVAQGPGTNRLDSLLTDIMASSSHSGKTKLISLPTE